MMKSISLVILVLASQAFADSPTIQQVPISPGSSVIEQLMDGRLVQFSCGAQAQPVNQAIECTASVTIQLSGLQGGGTQQVAIVGDSATSKLGALQALRANCSATLTQMSVSDGSGICANLSEASGATCKNL
jgi:hypothetical protein